MNLDIFHQSPLRCIDHMFHNVPEMHVGINLRFFPFGLERMERTESSIGTQMDNLLIFLLIWHFMDHWLDSLLTWIPDIADYVDIRWRSPLT